MALRPLHDAFGVAKVMLMSMQALSGAGYPGVPSYDAIENVIPYIGGEEPKVESEPQKMLGTLQAVVNWQHSTGRIPVAPDPGAWLRADVVPV